MFLTQQERLTCLSLKAALNTFLNVFESTSRLSLNQRS